MPGPSVSTYAYPWDVLDIGVDEVFAELEDVGVAAVDLATAYHPIATFSPRAGAKRMLYQERGAVFFPARLARYGQIKPEVWPDAEVVGAWPKAAEAARDRGVELRGWTIGMFQPWIAHAYPDCARTLATGAVVPAGACPASPAVQEYLAALAADMTDQFGLAGVRLEKVGFPAYDYGWVRPRVLLDIGPWTKWLLSLCFCVSCVTAAEAAGVDVAALRGRVVGDLRRAFDAPGDGDPVDDRDRRHEKWSAADPDYAEFVRLRDAAVVKLVATVGVAVRGVAPAASVGIYDVDDVNLEQVAAHVDVITLAFGTSDADAQHVRQLADAEQLRVDYLLHLTDANPPRSAVIERKLTQFASLPVDQIGIYNYGLLRQGQITFLTDRVRQLGQ
jgi:hypothetical protein